jgi:hypothetical protein
VHREERGGYDWRDYSCGASGLYALRDDGSLKGLATGARWCDMFRHRTEGLRLSRDGTTVFVGGDFLRGDCAAVVALDVRQQQKRELYRNCTSHIDDVAVSPDERRMVARLSCSWMSDGIGPVQVLPRGCVDGDGHLALISAAGGAPRPIGAPELQDPVWSPDGRAILAIRSGAWEIVHLDIVTGVERVVTRGGDPAWSPDGRWIAFVHDGDDGAFSLRIVRVDGSDERVLFTDPDWWFSSMETQANGLPHSPLWSPDGRRIVFARHHNRGHTLWSVNVDGTGLRRLTRPILKA